jgi:hypothetical protein
MSKKNKKLIKSFLKQNKLVLAAFSGVVAGISLAGIFGTEKSKKIIDTLSNSVNDFANKWKDPADKKANETFPLDADINSKKINSLETV